MKTAVLLLALMGVGWVGSATAADPRYTFGQAQAMPAERARAKCEEALAGVDYDRQEFALIWANEKRPVLDRVTDSLALGLPAAREVASAGRGDVAPAGIPTALMDKSLDKFVRANLALRFGRDAAVRNAFEEAIEAFDLVAAEDVVDPASYHFYRAVSAHALMKREESAKSLARLADVSDVPRRYLAVAGQMVYEEWSADPKDLANIGKLMDNSRRRLDLGRGGQKTQDIQKKIVFRLDEIIKELEQKGKGDGQAGGKPNCPPGGKPDQKPGPGDKQVQQPAQESVIMGGEGKGAVDEKKLRQLAENWGTLPPEKRAKVVQDITRDLPAKFEPMIKAYFEALNRMHPHK